MISLELGVGGGWGRDVSGKGSMAIVRVRDYRSDRFIMSLCSAVAAG